MPPVGEPAFGRRNPVDIEEFYDENPARRTSEEFEFGRDWHDADGNRAEVSWVQDTGELYCMREPTEPIIVDTLGGEYLRRVPEKELVVEVLGTIPTLEGVESALAGWSDAMNGPNSLAWLTDRVHAASGGSATATGPGPNDPEPTEIPGASESG
jgi:hypothetical protein